MSGHAPLLWRPQSPHRRSYFGPCLFCNTGGGQDRDQELAGNALPCPLRRDNLHADPGLLLSSPTISHGGVRLIPLGGRSHLVPDLTQRSGSYGCQRSEFRVSGVRRRLLVSKSMTAIIAVIGHVILGKRGRTLVLRGDSPHLGPY
jgi:hypothetical protein